MIKRAVSGIKDSGEKTAKKQKKEQTNYMNKAIATDIARDEGLDENQIKHYLSQVMKESKDLTKFNEGHYYSSLDRVQKTFSSTAKDMTQKEYDDLYTGKTLKDRREKFFNAVYDDRADLGNTEEGDGYKYMGRGPIQLTGKYNYEKYAEGMNPEDVASLGQGSRMSARYFKDKAKNLPEDATVDDHTDFVNKYTGKKSRKERRDIYNKMEVPKKINKETLYEDDKPSDNEILNKIRKRLKNEG